MSSMDMQETLIVIGPIRKEQKKSWSPQSLEFRDQMRPVSQEITTIKNREWVSSFSPSLSSASRPGGCACSRKSNSPGTRCGPPMQGWRQVSWAKCRDPPRLRIVPAAFHGMALIQGNSTSWSLQTWMLPARRTPLSGSGTTFCSST